MAARRGLRTEASAGAPTKLLAIYIVRCAVMDELAMIILTLPIFFPLVQALDFGFPPEDVAIWFGSLVLIVAGSGTSAPPFGLDVVVIRAIARQVPISEPYSGVLPDVAADFLSL